VLERVGLGAWLERRNAVLRHLYTLLVVMIGWVFFRAETLGYALDFLKALSGWTDGRQLVAAGARSFAARDVHLFVQHADIRTWLALVAGVLGSVPWLPRLRRHLEALRAAGKGGVSFAFELAGLVALCVVFVHTAMALAMRGYNPFIYFRF